MEKISELESEVELQKDLDHPNIVKYYGCQNKNKCLSIFLEYVEGGSLVQMLEKYFPFDEFVIKKFTRQILKGLEYLHMHQIIHRDIKGANVLVDVNGVCKQGDFGSAKKIAGLHDNFNSLRGTPNWMSPEVIQQKRYGRSSDIWSLGCTVLEMLTGKPPWYEYRHSTFILMNKIVETEELPSPIH